MRTQDQATGYVVVDGPLDGTEVLLPDLEVGEPMVVDVTDYAPAATGEGRHVYVVVSSPGRGAPGRLRFARSVLPGEEDELVA